MRHVKVGFVKKNKGREVSNHQTETQVLADGISFGVFEPKIDILRAALLIETIPYLSTFKTSSVIARQTTLIALQTIPKTSNALL